jgi:hypothetical protein
MSEPTAEHLQRAKEFLNERWPSYSVDAESLAALLASVAQEEAKEWERVVSEVRDVAATDARVLDRDWYAATVRYCDEILRRREFGRASGGKP